jgi:hypothetical protein
MGRTQIIALASFTTMGEHVLLVVESEERGWPGLAWLGPAMTFFQPKWLLRDYFNRPNCSRLRMIATPRGMACSALLTAGVA